MTGCVTINYLLEKSRVVAQASSERNFHIFHYLIGQFPEEMRKKLMIDIPAEDFVYLSQDGSPCATADHHDDSDECSKMKMAMDNVCSLIRL